MGPLTAAELLDVWDRGAGRTPPERALLLLAAACPETPFEELATWSVGVRDAHLLTLREWALGPSLAAVTACAGCGERLELAVRVADLRTDLPPGAGEPITVNVGGREVRVRRLDSADLLAAAGCADPAAAARLMLRRCTEGSIGELSDDAVDEVAAALAAADPQADVRLSLTCPCCGAGWQARFDVAGFFWEEIDAWAARTLREVHLLASAYGWRETDILALTHRRRRAYLELVSG
jgi:hypothetical protein